MKIFTLLLAPRPSRVAWPFADQHYVDRARLILHRCRERIPGEPAADWATFKEHQLTVMNTVCLILSTLAVTATLLGAAPVKTAELLTAGKEPVRIVCVGDSITGVYYHSGGLRAYPEMLEIALQKIYPQAQVTVRNAGVSGDTTKGALARLDRDVLAHKPHLVTVMFGMNDLVRTPLVEFKQNLTEIIARCRQAGAEVLLCTQNSVVETAARPRSRLAEFTQAIRDVGKEESLGVADCHALYEALRVRDALEWSLLLSDEIHPNMDGHKVFAAAIAQAISGKAVSLKEVGPPQPAMRHTLALLKAGKPVKVLAMPPYDQHIGPALTRIFPSAKFTVTNWPTEGQSLAQLDVAAKKVRAMAMDLVIIAVPATASADGPEDFHKHYSWIMNRALSFGPQQWDVIVIPPALMPKLNANERLHADLARRLIAAQDLHMIDRAPGDATPLPGLLAAWLTAHMMPAPHAADAPAPVNFTVKLETVMKHDDDKFHWFHPRAAAIPALDGGDPSVVMTIQKHLIISDYYSGLNVMTRSSPTAAWTGPILPPELDWRPQADGVTISVADVTPGWHAPTGKLIAIGCQVRYSAKGKQLDDVKRAHQTVYAVFDPKTAQWTPWRVLELPPEDQFDFARNACAQWLVQPDGTLLVPLYIGRDSKVPASTTVAECRFDGRKLSYVRHGTVLRLNVVRGLCEPSLIAFGGRYFLTLRNDLKGYVSVSDDGLTFPEPKPWLFDDGTELGSYNTQQHWLAHGEGLFLIYTRRGANNDHIVRHRAPLFMAQVNPEMLQVMRTTEKVVVPERGAELGNFGACAISERESWVTVSEGMFMKDSKQRGAEGSTFVARILWAKPNKQP